MCEVFHSLPSDGQSSDELVSEGLSLGNGAQTTDGDLFSVELDGSLGEAEPLLNDGGQFADSAALLAQNVLGSGGHDDDLGPGGGDSDLDAGVTIFGQLASQELVQLGFENAVGDKLERDKIVKRNILLPLIEFNFNFDK